jgi:hypothetical protein
MNIFCQGIKCVQCGTADSEETCEDDGTSVKDCPLKLDGILIIPQNEIHKLNHFCFFL